MHWEHSLVDRATGWLAPDFHLRFREVLVHACGRYDLVTPCYTLMPDHCHLVWMGTSERSDQRNATAFLRKHLAPMLGHAMLQDRPFDHVLREEQRMRGAFQRTCNYILENPERAELCGDWREWPYLGAVVCGYPVLDPRDAEFWDEFWKLYYLKLELSAVTDSVPALPRRATGRMGDGIPSADAAGSGVPVARSGRSGTETGVGGMDVGADDVPTLPRRATGGTENGGRVPALPRQASGGTRGARERP